MFTIDGDEQPGMVLAKVNRELQTFDITVVPVRSMPGYHAARSWGSLHYDGAIVNPEMFDAADKDLLKLTGVCRCCGSEVIGEEAVPDADPYSDEIGNDSTPVVECGYCRESSAADI